MRCLLIRESIRLLKEGILIQIIIPTTGSSTHLRSHTFAFRKTLIQVAGHPFLNYLSKPRFDASDLSELSTDLHF